MVSAIYVLTCHLPWLLGLVDWGGLGDGNPSCRVIALAEFYLT